MHIPPTWRERIWTVPNAISVGRLLLIPVAIYWISDEQYWAAGILIAVLGATDWIDGWIARRYDQTSELGKVLDPTADRLMLITVAATLLWVGLVPWWFGVLVLVREVLIVVAVLVLAGAGASRIDVQWAGKAGTLALMFAFPAFVFFDQATDLGRAFFGLAAYCFAVGGLILSYWAAWQYVPIARAALRDGRHGRHQPSDSSRGERA